MVDPNGVDEPPKAEVADSPDEPPNEKDVSADLAGVAPNDPKEGAAVVDVADC